MAASPPLTYGAGPSPSDYISYEDLMRGKGKTPPKGVSAPGKATPAKEDIPSVTVPPATDTSTLEIPSMYRAELTPGMLRGPGPGGVGNIDPRLVNAVIGTESGGRNILGSDKKSMGVMQVTADTARRMGYAPADMWDPQKNIAAGTQLLQHLLTKYKGDMFLTLAAYNAGEGAVDRGRIPESTRQYVQKVMSRLTGGGDIPQGMQSQPAVKAGQTLEIPQRAQQGIEQWRQWKQAQGQPVDSAAVPPDPFKQALPPGYANRLTGGLKPAQPSIDPFRELRAQYSPTFGGPSPMVVPHTLRNLANYPAQAIEAAYTPRLIQALGPERGRQAAKLLAFAAPMIIGSALGAPEAGGEGGAATGALEPPPEVPPSTAPPGQPTPSQPPSVIEGQFAGGRRTAPMGTGTTQRVGPFPQSNLPFRGAATTKEFTYWNPEEGKFTYGQAAQTEPLRSQLRLKPAGVPGWGVKLKPGTQVDIYPGTSFGVRGTVVEPGTPEAGKPAYADEQLTPPSPHHVAVREAHSGYWRWRPYAELEILEPYAETGELQYHGQAGKRPTEPLYEWRLPGSKDWIGLPIQGVERFHGTPIAIGEMLNPDEVPGGGQGLLKGPGFYTTDDYYEPTDEWTVTGGYAGERQLGPGSGQVYKVYEIRKGLKFIDSDYDPVGMDTVQDAVRRLPKSQQKAVMDTFEANWPVDDDGVYQDWTLGEIVDATKELDDPGLTHAAQKALLQQMQSEGYDGLTHEGGHITGGRRLHDVKIYWDPKRDIRLRQVQWRHPDLPVAPPTVGHEWGTEVGRRTVPSAEEHPPPKPISALERFGAAWGAGTAWGAEGPPPSLDAIEADKKRRAAAGEAPPPSLGDIKADKAKRALKAATPPDEANAPWPVRAANWIPTAGQIGGELLFGVGGPIVTEGTSLPAESAALAAGGGGGYGLGLEAKRGIRSYYGYPNQSPQEDAKEIAEQAAISGVTPVALRMLGWPIRLVARYLGPTKLKAALDMAEKFTKARAAYDAIVERVGKLLGTTREEAEDIAKTSNFVKGLPQDIPNILRRLGRRSTAARLAAEQRLREGIAAFIHEEGRLSVNAARGLENMKRAVRTIPEDVFQRLYGVGRHHIEQLLEDVTDAQKSLLRYPAMRQALNKAMEEAPRPLRDFLSKHVAGALGLGYLAGKMFHGWAGLIEAGVGAVVLGSHWAANSPPARALYRGLIDQDAHLVYNATRAIINAAIMNYRHEISSFGREYISPYMPQFKLGTGELVPRPPTPAPSATPTPSAGAAAPPPSLSPFMRRRPSSRPSKRTLEIPPAPPPPPTGAPPSEYNPEEERVFDEGGTE